MGAASLQPLACRFAPFLDMSCTLCVTTLTDTMQDAVGNIRFYSITFRLFKLPGLLEPDCEDYGQVAVYKASGCCQHTACCWVHAVRGGVRYMQSCTASTCDWAMM